LVVGGDDRDVETNSGIGSSVEAALRVELPYTPQNRQRLLHATTASEILYGGAAGGGKSHSIRWDGYDFCINNPGCVAVLVRQTLPQLEKNHIRKIRTEIPRELGEFNETKKVFNWWNGSIMAFQHLEYDKDINNFQGDEIHWMGIDEAALLKPEHLAEIITRLRLGGWQPTEHGKGRLPRLAMGSNPGGPAHLWLKKNFIDPAPPETVFYKTVKLKNKTLKKSRIFIPATMYDNEYLDAEYEAQFSELPEWKQQQLRDGDWNVVPGAFFDNFSQNHIIEPFDIPDWWPRYRSCDWGFATPFSIGEWTVADETPVENRLGEKYTFKSGTLIRIWEWYGADPDGYNKGLRLDPGVIANEIIQKRGKVSAGPGDPSMWRADSGPSFAEKFARAGLPFCKADNKREAGWQEMYRRIGSDMLKVTNNCTDFIRTITTLSSDPMNPDDVLKQGEDHVGDDVRYMCMFRSMKPQKPEKKRPSNDPIRFSDLVPVKTPERTWI
jgi:hypothetical protein